jgi:hypothetical protein
MHLPFGNQTISNTDVDDFICKERFKFGFAGSTLVMWGKYALLSFTKVAGEIETSGLGLRMVTVVSDYINGILLARDCDDHSQYM